MYYKTQDENICNLCCLSEAVTHILSQQSCHLFAELHSGALGHQFDGLPGHLSEAPFLPLRHFHVREITK